MDFEEGEIRKDKVKVSIINNWKINFKFIIPQEEARDIIEIVVVESYNYNVNFTIYNYFTKISKNLYVTAIPDFKIYKNIIELIK